MTARSPTTLYICRTVSSYRRFAAEIAASDRAIVIGSDQGEVHQRAERECAGVQIVFLDRMVSVFTVIPLVLALRDIVNDWLTGFADDKCQAHLLRWMKHAEGDWTTQKIQDALLLVHSYTELVKEIRPDEIVINSETQTWFEDALVAVVARARGVKVRIVGAPQTYGESSALGRTGTFSRINLPSAIVFFFIRVRQIWRIMRAHLGVGTLRRTEEGKEVIFLSTSNAEKGRSDIVAMSAEFARHPGIESLAVFWNARCGRKACQRAGATATDLERWCSLTALPGIVATHRRIRRKVQKQIDAFSTSGLLDLEGADLTPVIAPFVKRFVETELLARLCMQKAVTHLFADRCPAALRTRGDFRFDLEHICYHALKHRCPEPERFPLVFTNQVGLDYGINYGDPEIDGVDVSYVFGEYDVHLARSIRSRAEIVPAGAPFMTGGAGQDPLPRRNATDQSYTVCYLSSNIVPGVMTVLESTRILEALLETLRYSPRHRIVVKLHPTEDPTLLRDLLSRSDAGSRAEILPSTTPLESALQMSDIVVQKISTAALQAMTHDRPVVFFGLDGEFRFQEYWEGGCEIVNDGSSLAALIARVTQNDETYREWYNDRLTHQRAFLNSRFCTPDVPHFTFIVNDVIRRIEKRTEQEPLSELR